MRKQILSFMTICGVSMAAVAAPVAFQEGCQYTQLQNMVRDARNHEQIFEFIKAGVSMDDKTIQCGGTLLQLAIRRGNPSIVNGILTQDKARANKSVSLTGFEIPGAPAEIPVILFAAFYAPNEMTFKVIMEAGGKISARDSSGHGILWYLDKNPVLRRTATEDLIKQILQKQLLDQAKREMLQKKGTQIVETKLNAVSDNTPKELAEPDLAGNTLASPEEDQ
ncbi:MAG: hypothetical protein IKS41_01065 [Alphaproteobacteria bacterium]|nr:hypothetical protein [Alphaproteobacteria bacterium]